VAHTIRRLVHGAVAVAGLAALAPVLALVAAAVKLGDGGPVFFLQERVGLKGRRFRMWKFRTMSADPQAGGRPLTVGRDPRITRVGAFLRASRLDELPQLFNVVLGDMALVGPRPEVPRYVERYTPEQRRVLDFVPGITDLASIAYREEATLLAHSADPEATYMEVVVPEKIRINLEYAHRAGLLGDLRVIFATFAALLGHEWAVPRAAAKAQPRTIQLPADFRITGAPERPARKRSHDADGAFSEA
jgi:lipopolysaccharide/colanic/teichoic acid biosynthesis glycosyltransferase